MKLMTLFGATLLLSACGQGGTPANRTGDADGTLGPWFRSQHPCIGNRTDAMWFDDESTGYVGCGSTTEGYGLYQTTDGGVTWSSTPSANDFLAGMRVNSISRGPDGNLYIAGTGNNGARVVYLTPAGQLTEYYLKPSSGAQPWQTFQVGTFRIDGAGRAVSESLTGSDVMYWPSAGAEPVDGYGWWNGVVEGNGAQILDLEVYNGRFYGVGSTISQPPYFYFEPTSGMGSSFGFSTIKLSGSGLSAFTGEIWDIDIDDAGAMMLAGVNESSGVGMLWYTNGDATSPSSWTGVDVGPIVPEAPNNATRFYGACRSGDLMMAVGDYSQRSEAFAVLSTDGGATWNLFGPPGRGADAVGPLSKCQIFGSSIYITGADGYFGILDTSGL